MELVQIYRPNREKWAEITRREEVEVEVEEVERKCSSQTLRKWRCETERLKSYAKNAPAAERTRMTKNPPKRVVTMTHLRKRLIFIERCPSFTRNCPCAIILQSEEGEKVEKVKSVFGFQGKARGGDDDDEEEDAPKVVNPNRQPKPVAQGTPDAEGGMSRKERYVATSFVYMLDLAILLLI